MRRPTTRRRIGAAAVVLVLASSAACGDEGDERTDLEAIVDETTTTTAPSTSTTSAAPTTTTTERRTFSPTDVAGVMLTQADMPDGYGAPIPMASGADAYVTDPPECGRAIDEALGSLDATVELANYFDAASTYSTVTQAVSVAPDTDLAAPIALMGDAAAGPCTRPFHTESLGWATGTLTYEPAQAPVVGDEAIAYRIAMDIVQEGVHVLAWTDIVTARRGPFVFTVQVLTGNAADGSFTGPDTSMEDTIAYATLIDQRITALLAE